MYQTKFARNIILVHTFCVENLMNSISTIHCMLQSIFRIWKTSFLKYPGNQQDSLLDTHWY